MAERVGFEPTIPLTVYKLSKPHVLVQSALHRHCNGHNKVYLSCIQLKFTNKITIPVINSPLFSTVLIVLYATTTPPVCSLFSEHNGRSLI